MNLRDEQSRSKLCEGRNSGIGFAFCRKVDNETYETIMPISPCKDFLGDVVYSEHTGLDHSIYGLTTKKLGLWDCGVAYVAMGIMPVNHSTSKRKDHDELEKALMSPEVDLQSFLNYVDLKLGIRSSSFEKVAENRMVATIGLEWCRYSYSISLWSLLVRVCLKYRIEMQDQMEFLKKVNDDDAYYVKAAIPKLEYLINNPTSWPQQKHEKNLCHHQGIVGFAFPSK